MCKTLNDFILILVGGIIGALIGLTCVSIYWWCLERKTKPDSVDRVGSLEHQLDKVESRNHCLEKQMEELLIDTGKARRIGYVPIPDAFANFNGLIYPYTDAEHFVRSEGDRIAIYELPERYSKR